MKVFATTQHLKSFALEVNLKGGHVALGLISKSFFLYCSRFLNITQLATWVIKHLKLTETTIILSTFSRSTKRRSIKLLSKKIINLLIKQHQPLADILMMVTLDTILDFILLKGTWLLSNILGQEDWIKLNLRRVRYEELYNNFSLIAPAILIFGIQYPWISFMLGVANSYLIERSYSLNSNVDYQSYKKFLRYVNMAIYVGSFASGVTTFRKISALV